MCIGVGASFIFCYFSIFFFKGMLIHSLCSHDFHYYMFHIKQNRQIYYLLGNCDIKMGSREMVTMKFGT